MSDISFTLARWIAIPVALFVALNWLFIPSRLQLSQAVATTASASREKLKGVEYLFLRTPAFGELRILCSDAPPLCKTPIPPIDAALRVWLQDAGLLIGPRVVAAEFNGETVASPEQQAQIFHTTKVMWSIGAALALALAAFLWHFAPSKASRPREA